MYSSIPPPKSVFALLMPFRKGQFFLIVSTAPKLTARRSAMSSTFEAYVVSLDKLQQVIGSSSQQLTEAVLASEDYDLLTNVDDIDDEAGFSLADAISFLI